LQNQRGSPFLSIDFGKNCSFVILLRILPKGHQSIYLKTY
jgi:hypothetical protein